MYSDLMGGIVHGPRKTALSDRDVCFYADIGDAGGATSGVSV
jgi:hypothetical protein